MWLQCSTCAAFSLKFMIHKLTWWSDNGDLYYWSLKLMIVGGHIKMRRVISHVEKIIVLCIYEEIHSDLFILHFISINCLNETKIKIHTACLVIIMSCSVCLLRIHLSIIYSIYTIIFVVVLPQKREKVIKSQFMIRYWQRKF